jgi:hypothetical protein
VFLRVLRGVMAAPWVTRWAGGATTICGRGFRALAIR